MDFNIFQPVFLLLVAILTVVKSAEFKGCYEENKRRRTMNVNPGDFDPNNLTPGLCASKCGLFGYAYAGVTGGNFCFCANQQPPNGQLKPNECTMPCTGNAAEKCGDLDHVSVYQSSQPVVGLKVEPNPPLAGFVKTGDPVTFDVSVVSALGAYYQFSYDDGADRTPKNETGMYTHSFNVPGVYSVKVYGSDLNDTIPEGQAVTTVAVKDEVGPVSVDCPDMCATYEYCLCEVKTYQGSEMELNDTVDGDAQTPFKIADPVYDTVGFAIQSVGPYDPNAQGDGSYILKASEFRMEGKVLGLQIFGETAGTISVLILEPVCATGNYCPESNDCRTSCLGYQTMDCSAGIFCPSSKTCTSSCPVAARPVFTFDYKLKQKESVTISVGFNHYSLSTDIPVSPGDILGFEQTAGNGVVAMSKTAGNGDYHIGSSPTTFTHAGLTTIPNRMLFNAIMSSPSMALLHYELPLAKSYTIDVSVQNTYGAKTNSTQVMVIEGINITDIIAPIYAAANEATSFNLQPHTGSDIVYTWNFGDGEENTTTLPYQHTFTYGGSFNVTCEAFNPMSRKSNFTEVMVEYRIAGLGVTSTPSAANTLTDFSFVMTTGSNFTCIWDFGDGSDAINKTDTDTPSGGAATVVQHMYTTDGNFNVNVTCYNNINKETVLLVQNVEYPITDLNLITKGADKNTAFKIKWTIQHGSSPVVSLFFNGVTYIKDAPTNGFTELTTKSWETTEISGLPVGLYDLQLSVQNQFNIESENISFTVEAAMKDVVSTVSKTTVPTAEPITFTLDMTEGSNVNYVFNWDNGNFVNGTNPGDWATKNPRLHTETHSFNDGRIYTVKITAWNAASSKEFVHEILAIQSVNQVEMHNEEYYRFTPPAYPHFNFSVIGTPPNEAQVFFDFGDSKTESLGLQIDYNYDHEYRDTGPFSVTANIYNNISAKEFVRNINIIEVLQNLQIATNPPHAAINNPIALDVILYRAPTGNDCLITVNYGGGIPDVIDRPRTGSGQNGKDTLPDVTYTTLGTKTITVTVTSPLESLTKQLDIEVQDPVDPSFTVTAGPDANGEFTHPGPATITIGYTGTVRPTDASYSISIGDGSFINGSFNTLFTTVPGTGSLSHSFTNDGTFNATVTIYNLASSETTTFHIGSYIAIADSTAAVTYKPALPLDAPEENGLLNQVGKFPRDRPIIFTMTHTSGTIEGYDIIYSLKSGGPAYTCSKTKSPFEIDFPGSGLFEVQITAKNPLYSNTITTDVTILDRVVGTNITDLVPNVGSGVKKKIGIQFDIQGDQTCLSIDFGDGIEQLLSDDPIYCTSHSSSTAKHIGALTGVTEIEHTYNSNGYYTVVATAYNSFSNSTNSISVPVSRALCKDPTVTIQDQSFQFYNPMIVKKGKQFSIVGQSDILCATTLENIKTWSIETVDDNSGQVTGVIDLSTYSTRTNAELHIPARSLDYGLYKATYTMEMSGADFDGGRFVTSSYTYFRVDESDIVGIIQQGGISEIVRGLQSITLEPHKWSFDPDDTTPIGSQTFDSYTWNCTPANLNATVAHCNDLVPTPTVGSPVSIDLAQAIVNADFQFCVIIKKGTRATTACLVVQLVPGTPPDVYLECTASSVCNQLADGQLIPPSGRLGVKCECTSSSCANLQLEYSWIFYVYDYRWPWKDIQDIQEYAVGIDSKELAINRKLFEDHPNVTQFRAGCTANIAGHSEVGKAYMNFMINSKPTNGTCSVDKTDGIVSTQKSFCIMCQDWYDEQGIAEYQIIVRLKDDDVFREVMAVTKFDGPLCLDLPMGAKYNDFKEDLLVRIKDNLGSVNEVLVSEVTVRPLSATESQALVSQFLNDKFDPFDKIYAEGDTNTVAAITSNLVAILNSDSKKAQSEYAGVGVASSTTNTGFGPSDADRDGAYVTSESSSNPVLNKKYEEEKDLRSQLKQQAVEALSKVTTGSVTAVKQISSSLSEFVHYPEEVTLKSASLAINKTLEMAKYMADLKDVSYEDRKSTFIYMAATLGGALDAIGFNGDNPSLTELDEAKDLPSFKVYDTDWENTDGGITAGNFEEALGEHGKHTHKNYAGTKSAGFIDKATETMLLLAQGFSTNSVPGEEIPFTTNRLKGVVTNQDAKALLGNKVSIADSNATLLLPNDIGSLFPGENKTENDSFVLQLLQTTSVPYQYSKSSNDLAADSNGLVIDIFDDDGNVRVIKNLVIPIEFKIPRDVNAPVPKYKEADPFVANWDYFYYHRVNITKKGASLHVQFDISNSTTKFLVVVKFGEFPDIEKNTCDYVGVIPDDNMPPKYRYTYFLDNRNVSDFIGSVYIGVREIEPNENPSDYKTCNDIPKYEKGSGKPDDKYNFRVFSTGCYFYNKTLKDWSTEGCWVGPETDEGATHCFCNHLTTFAGGWVVVPNTIDWNFIFSNADFAKNPTLYITEIVIAILYLFAVIWARREDKKDLERIGVTPLKDNDPRDKYYYEVVVITGMRRNAGTDSKVCFIMSGEHDETDVRMFTDDKRKIFRRGAVDSFLVAVPRPLGTLNYARVWHDNSGKGKMASWYLKYLMVRDIQTNQRSVFICNKWFAVEEDDGQVDRVIPVAGKAQMTEFGHLFAEKSKKSLIDGHLWFSVVARPAQSRFTRVQRVSCCLLLLFVSMLGNAMFYGTATSSSTTYTFGPFALSPEQIFIGIAVNLIIFPINFFVMTLFRKSRARKMKPSRIDEALKRGGLSPASNAEGEVKSDMGGVWMSRSPTMMAENRAGTSASMRPETSFSSVSRMGERNYEALRVEKKKKKKKFEFPWWCSILGWILLWLGVGVSVAFVTFYGITFQDEKCKKWITSMLTSFFTSVFITQPVKVFLTAIFFSLVVKNPGEEEDDEVEDEEAHKLGADEEYLHFEDGYGATRPRKIGYKPPDPAELEKARIQRLNEIKMWEIVREIVFYAFFLWILMVISYRNRSPDAYFYKDSLQKTFIENTETNHWFSKVRNTAEYWKWARSGLLNGIRASSYYNSDPPLLLRGFVNDKVSRIMGYATMRQLRVRPGLCDIRGVMKNVIHECNEPYSLSNEDEETYMPEWKKLNSTQSKNDTGLPWVFSKADVLNGYPYWGVHEVYGGGGYVQRLQGSKEVINQTFKILESQDWIDRYTRAVFVEFTVYNPQVNLFAIATIVAEFDASGGVTTSYRFEPAMLLPYMSSVMLFQIACEVIYLLFTAWFIIKAVKNIFKEKMKYFFVFWNIIELGIIAVSLGAVIVYFYRLIVTNELTAIFARSHGNEYMKFQYAGYWNEIFTYMIGWLVFFGTLKFLKLLRFNKRMALVAATLKNGSNSLIHFGIIFLIVYMAFMQLFYLTFMNLSTTFSTFVTSMESGVLMMMGKFDIYSMLMVEPFLTQLFVFGFVVTITFILVNMFLSILNETFGAVREDMNKVNNDYEIVDFMVGRFKRWTGIGSAPANTLQPSDLMTDAKGRPYNGPQDNVTHFPDRIDKLLNSISNIYMDENGIARRMNQKEAAQNKSNMKSMFRGNSSQDNDGLTEVQN